MRKTIDRREIFKEYQHFSAQFRENPQRFRNFRIFSLEPTKKSKFPRSAHWTIFLVKVWRYNVHQNGDRWSLTSPPSILHRKHRSYSNSKNPWLQLKWGIDIEVTCLCMISFVKLKNFIGFLHFNEMSISAVFFVGQTSNTHIKDLFLAAKHSAKHAGSKQGVLHRWYHQWCRDC